MALCFASGLCEQAFDLLAKEGFKILDPVPSDAELPHSDLYVHITPENIVYSAGNTSASVLKISDNIGSSVSNGYPECVLYNCVCVGRNLFCNTKTVLPAILDDYTQNGYNIVDVKQGYTKCSVIPLDNAMITDDAGIAAAAKAANIDCLLIAKGSVSLKGYQYGLIGGTAGVYKNRVYWNGEPYTHSDWRMIDEFLTAHNYSSVSLCSGKLSDIGSILFCQKG